MDIFAGSVPDIMKSLEGVNMDTLDVTAAEILDIHRYGQKQGFIAGVVVCLGVRYVLNRRQAYRNALADARRQTIR